MLMSAERKGCVTSFIYLLDLLWVRYNCAKFHHCKIYVTDFREGAFLPLLPPLHPWAAPKKPILNKVKKFQERTFWAQNNKKKPLWKNFFFLRKVNFPATSLKNYQKCFSYIPRGTSKALKTRISYTSQKIVLNKHFRIILFICFINWINQYYWYIKTVKVFFCDGFF